MSEPMSRAEFYADEQRQGRECLRASFWWAGLGIAAVVGAGVTGSVLLALLGVVILPAAFGLVVAWALTA